MSIVKRILQLLLALIVCLALLIAIHTASVYWNFFGAHESAGSPNSNPVPAALVEQKLTSQQSATLRPADSKQILFGDLHVHTSFSRDAFIMSLPVLGGGGSHPPADACDFARHCSGLDFWGISDHAEGLTPRHWRETKEAIRQCNAIAGNPDNPDLVSFLGWEWSQTGDSAENHYGHKNVFFKESDDDKVPARPIGSGSKIMSPTAITAINTLLAAADFGNRQRYYDHQYFMQEYSSTPPCSNSVASTALPEDCEESALTPEVLNQKLDDWGFDSLIIPHGTAWGITSPMGADFATQLNRRDHNPLRQNLIEVFSGHGNSEEYRPWREVAYDADGHARCPSPAKGFMPGCYRAGEIIFNRCLQEALGKKLPD